MPCCESNFKQVTFLKHKNAMLWKQFYIKQDAFCKTQFTDHLSIKVNNKQKLSCVLKPKYVMQKPVRQGMTVPDCEQLRRDKFPTYTPNSIVTIYIEAMRQELVLT